MRLFSKVSLSAQIFIGLGLGVATGIFLGDLAAPVKLVGDGYIHLLQMAVLPYIIIALISGLGKLKYQDALNLSFRVGSLLVLSDGFSGQAHRMATGASRI